MNSDIVLGFDRRTDDKISPEEDTGSTVCRQSGLEKTVRVPVHLLATFKLVNVARIAQSENLGQKWIQRQVRGETKPSKHRVKPSEQTRHTSLQVTLSEVASLQVPRNIGAWYGVWK